VESGTAAAAAAAAGLTDSAHEQAEEEAAKQATEPKAHAILRQLDAARIGGKQHAPYWNTLVTVLVPEVGRLKCIKGGDGVCGKLLSSKNIAKSAKDLCKERLQRCADRAGSSSAAARAEHHA